MAIADWLVVGGGLTGAALAYELARQGLAVVLIEPESPLQGATRYSYGGIAHWAGTTPLLQRLGEQGLARQRQLPAELGLPTFFRELPLLLTVALDQDPQAIAAAYQPCRQRPQLLEPAAAAALEPLLNPGAIAAALQVTHAQVDPEALVQAYRHGLCRHGGQIRQQQVTGFVGVDKPSDKPSLAQPEDISEKEGGRPAARASHPLFRRTLENRRVQGVRLGAETLSAGHVVLCTGTGTRSLLAALGIYLPVYSTQAEIIETGPTTLHLRTLVMPAALQRPKLEAQIAQRLQNREAQSHGTSAAPSTPESPQPSPQSSPQSSSEDLPAILDAGAVQLCDGRIRMGQVSRGLPALLVGQPASPQQASSELWIRDSIGRILPTIAQLPGVWRSCGVSFSPDGLPFLGPIPGIEGVFLFTGFSSPFAYVPPLAQGFSRWLMGEEDQDIQQMLLTRFL